MKISKTRLALLSGLALAGMIAGVAEAHDPVFGIGPHVLYKNGFEVHLGAHREKSDDRATEAELELKYGLTGDWVAGLGTGYIHTETHDGTQSGRGPATLATKYRFWRRDTFGAQEATAIFGKVILNDGDSGHHGAAERDGNDYLLGLAYGYEGRKWYRWASVRRRFNADTAGGARPDKWLADLVIGIRPTPTEYLEPDWVWMLELNFEHTGHITGVTDVSSRRIGGDQWFLSPGLMWTYRNFAVKAGVQLPVYDNLAGDQEADDYRALVELEWHL